MALKSKDVNNLLTETYLAGVSVGRMDFLKEEDKNKELEQQVVDLLVDIKQSLTVFWFVLFVFLLAIIALLYQILAAVS